MSTTVSWSDLRERFFSPLGLHVAAFSLMAIAAIVLGIRVGLDWQTTSSSNQDAMAERQVQLRALQVQTAPLRGLDKRVDESRKQIEDFYATRIPPSYSSILEQLGVVAGKGPVRLTGVQYTPAPGSGDLTEIRMDAGLTGDYPAIMRFVNGLERSPTFFVVRAMALTGQQSGAVNLRLQVSTWMRPADVPVNLPAIDMTPSTVPGSTPIPSGKGEGQ